MNYLYLSRISSFLILCIVCFAKRAICNSSYSQHLLKDANLSLIDNSSRFHRGNYSTEAAFVLINDTVTDPLRRNSGANLSLIDNASRFHSGNYSTEAAFILINDTVTDPLRWNSEGSEDNDIDIYYPGFDRPRIEAPVEDVYDDTLYINDASDEGKKSFFASDYHDEILMDDSEEDFNFADIVSLSESQSDMSIDRFTPEQKKEIVDLHNLYRSNFTDRIPQASDMNFMEYNETLEKQASELLKSCKFEQYLSSSKASPEQFGINFYIGSSRHPSRVLWSWYREHKWYSFENGSCLKPYPKHMCGHFTQMLWGESNQIGCARKSYCFPRHRSRLVMACLYYPAGNYMMSPVYRVGKPCTRCKLQNGNLCHKSLCVDKNMCHAHKLDCACKTVCKNCVNPNPNTCKCETCKLGWDWEDCSFSCMDAASYYGFHVCPPKLNEVSCLRKTAQILCRESCGLCKAVNKTASPKSLCCKGKTCKPHYVLDTKSCECVLDCPSQLCLYPSSKKLVMSAFDNKGRVKFRSNAKASGSYAKSSILLLSICSNITIFFLLISKCF